MDTSQTPCINHANRRIILRFKVSPLAHDPHIFRGSFSGLMKLFLPLSPSWSTLTPLLASFLLVTVTPFLSGLENRRAESDVVIVISSEV
jgi:hypothetical protein